MKPDSTHWEARLDQAKRAHRATGPSEAQLARMLHAIEAAPSSPAAGAPFGAKIAKITLVVLGVVAGGIAALWPAPPAPSLTARAPRSETSAAPAPTHPVPVPVPTPVAPVAGAPPTPEPAAAKPEERARGGRREAPDPVGELALLQRARRIVLRDPARALVLAQAHARDYPRGVFAEERELLAVQALLGAHRRAEAARRAQRFERTHPSSVHAHRMHVMLDEAKD